MTLADWRPAHPSARGQSDRRRKRRWKRRRRKRRQVRGKGG